jgi:hypothetical protein
MQIYDQNLKTKLQEFLIQESEEEASKRKQKDTFWASETEKPLFDIYHTWMGTPVTNPVDAEKLVMFSAAKMMELALVTKLQKMGIAKKGDEQQRFQIEREGIQISGYTDCIFTDGSVGEIKTYYGDYQTRELEAGRPKTNYLKQLAIYLDALDQDRGKLIYLDRGTGAMYEFTLLREKNLQFKCMNIEFDLLDTYKKWAKFYEENILKEKEPDPFIDAGKYKADINTLDWTKVSKADIGAARNGHKVIGENRAEHWKVLYSPYKDLWIQKQGQTLGYTSTELAKIKDLTKNYSSKK